MKINKSKNTINTINTIKKKISEKYICRLCGKLIKGSMYYHKETKLWDCMSCYMKDEK